MAASSILSVLAYERLGKTAPFFAVAVLSGGWAAVILLYFTARHRGHLGKTFAAAEAALLERRLAAQSGARTAAATRPATVKVALDVGCGS